MRDIAIWLYIGPSPPILGLPYWSSYMSLPSGLHVAISKARNFYPPQLTWSPIIKSLIIFMGSFLAFRVVPCGFGGG